MNRTLIRLLGNFGVSFFSPLVSGNIAESAFNVGITFEETILIAFISSIFVTGLTISRELEKIGRKR